MAVAERERRKGERGVWGAASARPTARKRKSVVGGSHLNERVVPVTPAPGLLLAPVPIELGARDHETARELPPGRDDPPCGKNNPGDASCLRGRVLHATASGVTKSSPPRGGGVQQAASRRQTQQHMPFSASLLLLCLEPRNAYLDHNRRRRVCGRGIANQAKRKRKRKRLDACLGGRRCALGGRLRTRAATRTVPLGKNLELSAAAGCAAACSAFGLKGDHEGKTRDIHAHVRKYFVHAISTLDFPFERFHFLGLGTPQHRGQ